MTEQGVDVSRYQGTIDWSAVKKSGRSFAFVKATDGTSYGYTEYYLQNIAQVRAAGLIPGAYHWLRAGPNGELRDPVGQARYFLSIIGDPNGLLCAVDVEVLRSSTGAITSKPDMRSVQPFADEFHRLAGPHPLFLYTGEWYWVGYIGNPPASHIGPLWHSEYDKTQADIANGPELDNYGGWGAATIWQYTSSGTVAGISGSVDLNLYYGTRDQLLTYTHSGDAPPEDMFTVGQFEDIMRKLDDIQNRTNPRKLVRGDADPSGRVSVTDGVTKRHVTSQFDADWLKLTDLAKFDPNAGGSGAFVVPQDFVDSLADVPLPYLCRASGDVAGESWLLFRSAGTKIKVTSQAFLEWLEPNCECLREENGVPIPFEVHPDVIAAFVDLAALTGGGGGSGQPCDPDEIADAVVEALPKTFTVTTGPPT